ncbi:Structural maintenance of chromosomes protein 6 [Termitomyces sp. T112]|nr:Structural maintenance of chromosomes protein 6 [Termitomyces sp. T112]
MAKRHTDSDSDDAESHYEQTPKRARTSDDAHSDGDSEDSQQNGRKGKAKAETRFNDDVEEHGETDNEQEEQKFEDAHAQKILADLASKRKIQGGIAEHGIIERVEMVNFMCHAFLKFEFGPQINFIIGHNGSGKSAVLSAITVALGGKSASTGRGSGLKSFIKEGCAASEVTIYLKNQGEEAYKPEEYGKSIIVTRRFTKDGNSTWKIRGANSPHIISAKKEELAAICDHMNIQVDNPLNVLTQDAARQFLSASAPGDKYKFFLRGTQLSQLSDEYTTCLANIKQTHKVLEQKKEALPDLRIAFKEATVRFQEAAKARQQKQKADELKKELAWAHVRSKEEEMENKFKEVAKQESRLPKIQKNIEDAERNFAAATEEVAQYENEVAAIGEMDELTKERDRLQGLIRSNKDEISKLTTDLKKMDGSIVIITDQIKDFDQKIAEETERMAANTQAKHEETQRQLEEARANVKEAQGALDRLMREIEEQNAKTNALKAEGSVLETTVTAIRTEIQNCEGMIQRAKDAEKNSLIPYGNNIKGVLDAIKNERWVGDRPVGPLGLFVKAKDATKWGELLRSQLSQYLTAFAVTNNADRVKLHKLLSGFNNHNTLIIINSRDMFDYSRGEPPEGYLTVLRALEISDPYVLRIMINVAKIERIHLAYSRAEAQSTLEGLHGGGTAWTSEKFMNVRVFPEGGASITPLSRNTGRNDATSLLLTGRDAASEIAHYHQQIKVEEAKHQAAIQDVQRKRAEWNGERQKLDTLKSQRAKVDDRFRRAKTYLANLQQTANDDMPSNITSLQAAKEEAEGEKTSTMEQAAHVLRRKKEFDDANKALVPDLQEIKERIKEFNQRKGDLIAKAQDAAEKRMKAQHVKDSYTTKLDDEKAAIAKLQAHADVLQEEFTNWTAKALEYCERFPNPRKVEEVDRNLKSVQEALAERERRQGATVEEMTIEVNKAKAKLDAVERDLKQMTTLNKALKASLTVRLQRWQDFRRHIALRCKLVFAYHLSHRGYYGKVLFNHDKGSLVLKVVTDDQAATQASQAKREKDPRSLSGGEKSFSTICLLLSLWESIGCPLRCLDEFDVFMDAVNRRISMKMMIDTANSSDKKQYILITPQDMGNVQIGPTVKVNRMTDPERNQT